MLVILFCEPDDLFRGANRFFFRTTLKNGLCLDFNQPFPAPRCWNCVGLTLVRCLEIARLQELGSILAIVDFQNIAAKNEGERHEIRLA
jgi:hypothetical protein